LDRKRAGAASSHVIPRPPAAEVGVFAVDSALVGEVRSPLKGTIVRVDVAAGGVVQASTPVAVIESMKMEYVIEAGVAGTVRAVRVTGGDPVQPGEVLIVIETPADGQDRTDGDAAEDGEADPTDRLAREEAVGFDVPVPAAATSSAEASPGPAAATAPVHGPPAEILGFNVPILTDDPPPPPPPPPPAPVVRQGEQEYVDPDDSDHAPPPAPEATAASAPDADGDGDDAGTTAPQDDQLTRPAERAEPGAPAGLADETGDPAEGDESVGAFGSGAAVADAEIRSDLEEVVERHRIGLDAARAEAVERRRRTGQRTARENVVDLVDHGTFVEYGPLVIAAQRRRRELQDLIERTPADGLVAGVGRVGGVPTAVLSYDYTVLAGTQGLQNHRKKDRLFDVIERQRLPVVFFAEGGGGRPGDTDGVGVSGLDCMAFALWGRLSGLVPLVGIVSGRCFAGNAAILGCCDVVIATQGSNIGMGGPAMIEGGGLGVFEPEDIGPMDVQVPNGVVDVAVRDEAEAVRVAKQYLAYFSRDDRGASRVDDDWTCVDQTTLRGLIPENRRQAYDVRTVVGALADTGSVLELRPEFGPGMVTALARVEGRPLGLIANNPMHLAGAIDADGADKAARFMQLCDAYDVPLVFLCDTPGIMVGPEAERTALVRHVSRLFVTGASLTVPFGTIVLRKGYGLGAQTMAGGSFKSPLFCVAWPTGELGGMGLEGAVRLGYRAELEAIDDPEQRERAFEEMVARSYEHGKALNAASHFEIDDVIDPADSRSWVTTMLAAAPVVPPRPTKKRPYIDTW
jgi:acetyl-CoA carboxylase carboxyltransferase component